MLFSILFSTHSHNSVTQNTICVHNSAKGPLRLLGAIYAVVLAIMGAVTFLLQCSGVCATELKANDFDPDVSLRHRESL